MAIKNKNDLLFYEAVGRLLTKRLADKKITVSTLASRLDLQFNTVKAVSKGIPFYAHQLVWIMKELNISMEEITNEMEDGNGKEESTVEDLI